MYTPIILGFIALIFVIALLVLDRKNSFKGRVIKLISKSGLHNEAASRLFSTLKGFLLIVLLAFVLGALLYYFQ
jgi:hypothetical protein